MAARTGTRSRGTAPEHARDYVGVALAYAKRAAADKQQLSNTASGFGWQPSGTSTI
jgi:hypothetical protein